MTVERFLSSAQDRLVQVICDRRARCALTRLELLDIFERAISDVLFHGR
jgi:hypothetical protein